MRYKNIPFDFPNFTKVAKSDADDATFFGCDFSAVQNINLSGFKSVVFSGWNTVFRPSSIITINGCKSVKFENTPFQNERSTLNITSAEFITFDTVTSTYKMKLQIQNCGEITYDKSTLNFDTSNVHAKKFKIEGSQIAQIDTLDLTGITEQFLLTTSNVFNLKEMILRPRIMIYIDSLYNTKQILEQITRFQER